MAIRKIARDAITGRFITRRTAKRRPETSVIETVRVRRPKRRRLVRPLILPQ